MKGIAAALQPYLDQYGYGAVFVAIFLEDFGLPVPGETMLIAGSLLAARGTLDIVSLLATAWVAAVAGDNVGYLIGRVGGRRLVFRYGQRFLITPERMQYVEGFFRRHGGEAVVAFARFFAILRQLNGIAAGIARMPWQRFLFFNALGAALWVGLWGTLFYAIGAKALRFGDLFKTISLLAIAAAAVAAWVVYRRRRR